MKRWLKDKVHVYGAKKAREDMERALSILRGQDDEEVSQTLASAYVIRRMCEEELGWPIAELFYEDVPQADAQRSQYLISFLGLIKQLQKDGNLGAAAGAMVWLHSLRTIIYPEVRMLGKQLWRELYRGFDYIDDRLFEIMGSEEIIRYGEDRLVAEIRSMTPPNLRESERRRSKFK